MHIVITLIFKSLNVSWIKLKHGAVIVIVNNNLLCLTVNYWEVTFKKRSGMTYINFTLNLVLRVHVKNVGANVVLFLYIVRDIQTILHMTPSGPCLFYRKRFVVPKSYDEMCIWWISAIVTWSGRYYEYFTKWVLTDRITPRWCIYSYVTRIVCPEKLCIFCLKIFPSFCNVKK